MYQIPVMIEGWKEDGFLPKDYPEPDPSFS
jgi:hypothetical protein